MSALRALGSVVLMFVALSACTEPTADPPPAPVEIEMTMGNGQVWSASGGAVGSGRLCARGTHRWVGYRALDGSPMDYQEGAALKRMQPAMVLMEAQLACADGTGSISIAWEPDLDNQWMIVAGSGAYRGVGGGGVFEATSALVAADRQAVLTGEITGG